MHDHLGLRQGAVDQQATDTLPGGVLLGCKGKPQVALYVPFGKQLQLTTQQRLVVMRQVAVEGQTLLLQQGLDGIVEQLVGIVFVYHVQIGLAAQVIENQEALLEIGSQHLRHMHTGAGQQCRDTHEGLAVFLRWRRIHQNQAALTGLPTKIAAKAGVAAGGSELGRRHRAPFALREEGWQLLGEPGLQLLQTYIVFRHQGVSDGASRCAGHALLSSIFFSPSRGVRPLGR